MKPLAEDANTGIITELIDLDDTSLDELKNLDNTVVNHALRYATEQANRPSNTETSCSSLSRF